MKNRDYEIIISNMKEITKNMAAKMASEAKLGCKKLEDYCQQQQEAEQLRLQKQQAQAQIRNREEIANCLRQSVSFALSQVPEHLRFYDIPSRYSIKVRCDNDCYYIVLLNKNILEDTRHYHYFNDSLQICFDQLHKDALDALYGRIMKDADQWRNQQLQFSMTGMFTGKMDSEFSLEYTQLFQQWLPFLYRVSNIVTVPISGGVRVSFAVTFDDGGFHPDHYFNNLNRSI